MLPDHKGQTNISKLHCEPNPARDGFVRVYIDDELISELALPFRADSAVIALSGGDPDYPTCIPEDEGWVVARSVQEFVIWVDPLVWAGYTPNPSFGVLAFRSEQYASTLPGNINRLANLTPEEFRNILLRSFPPGDSAIYVSPESPGDVLGARLVRRTQRLFFDELPEQIRVAAPPEKWLEIRIGLDAKGFPECVWRVGETKDDLAVWFVSNPSFPLWVSGKHVTEAFRDMMPR